MALNHGVGAVFSCSLHEKDHNLLDFTAGQDHGIVMLHTFYTLLHMTYNYKFFYSILTWTVLHLSSHISSILDDQCMFVCF